MQKRLSGETTEGAECFTEDTEIINRICKECEVVLTTPLNFVSLLLWLIEQDNIYPHNRF